MAGKSITRVSIEYSDGSSSELVGENAVNWIKYIQDCIFEDQIHGGKPCNVGWVNKPGKKEEDERDFSVRQYQVFGQRKDGKGSAMVRLVEGLAAPPENTPGSWKKIFGGTWSVTFVNPSKEELEQAFSPVHCASIQLVS